MQVSYRMDRCKRVTVYEQAGVCFCCEDMRHEWGILIGFGINGHPRTTSREVNLFGLHQFSTGTIIPAITEVRYCPWCGEDIEIVHVKQQEKPRVGA